MEKIDKEGTKYNSDADFWRQVRTAQICKVSPFHNISH